MVWRLWGAGAPVLLLHGGSGSWTHWLRNIPALVQAGHLVCAPEAEEYACGLGGSSARPRRAGKCSGTTCATMMLHRPEAIDATAVALQEYSVPLDRMPGRKLVTTDAVGRALQQLTCPVWAAYGSEDVVFREHWPTVEAAWRKVPRLQEFIRFPDAGHWLQYELPGAVNALLLRIFAA